MSLWGCVGVAAAEGLVANNGGSLGGVQVSQDSCNLLVFVELVDNRTETYGRKLQAEAGRLATRVKISEISRCCTLVS